MNKQYLFILVIFLNIIAINYAQNNLREIFPFVRYCISSDSLSFCIVKNDKRLNNPNSYYSSFLLSNMTVLDSFSLDDFSNTGASPKSLFIWETSSKKYICLEYNEGSGVGHHLIQETKLFLFDVVGNKINNILTVGTDSLNLNTQTNYLFEVNSKIIPYKDTLFIIRTCWKEAGELTSVKKKTWEQTTSIIMSQSHLIVETNKGLPFFMMKNIKSK